MVAGQKPFRRRMGKKKKRDRMINSFFENHILGREVIRIAAGDDDVFEVLPAFYVGERGLELLVRELGRVLGEEFGIRAHEMRPCAVGAVCRANRGGFWIHIGWLLLSYPPQRQTGTG